MNQLKITNGQNFIIINNKEEKFLISNNEKNNNKTEQKPYFEFLFSQKIQPVNSYYKK